MLFSLVTGTLGPALEARLPLQLITRVTGASSLLLNYFSAERF